jgi:peptidoglycan/LPS O-acetylase OafA/YrhL
MWARVVEFMLGCWLAISPFIFAHADDQIGLWATDWICATLVITLALLSYWHPTRHAHVLTLLVAAGLIVIGRFSTGETPSPAMQNQIVVGLLLLMFSLVPNAASRPPASWQNRQGQPTLSQ